MDDSILLSQLNDFIFCPASIYFHALYGSMDTMLYQDKAQINGTNAHKSVDEQHYSTRKDVLQGIDVYCEKYRLIGKIDLYDMKHQLLTERKKKIKVLYDGYIFQLYGQYFAMKEMGYQIKTIRLYSMDDNKVYPIKLPENDNEMLAKFENTINDIRNFDMFTFNQNNKDKCAACIYEPACDRGRSTYD